MRLRCPNCRCNLDVVADAIVVEVKCPSCGSQVDLGSQTETVTYIAPKLGRLGQFELIEHIGRGHFGDVYKALDSRLNRMVAVKVPRAADMEPADREAFFREARTAASLRHANIVTVHEVGTIGHTIFIASELIDGVNLADLVSARALEPKRAAQIAAAVGEALEHAHQQGVVHRDLKPRNIMLDEAGQPHLLDFGLAKQAASDFTITAQGDILGTPAYMAPEQARGNSGEADRRTDVYALGVTLYEMLTGQRPFEGEVRGLLYQIVHEEPPPPRRLVTAIPRDLETICLKAMSKSPAERYPTAAELSADLRRFLADEPIHARRAGSLERGWRWCRRNPVLTAACSLALAASAALGLLAYAYASSDVGPPKRRVSIDVRLAEGPFPQDGDPQARGLVRVVFWPLDREGTAILDRPVRAQGQPPIHVRLAGGEYFVVAVDEQSGRFHEVFRRVPQLDEKVGGLYRHDRWKLAAGEVVSLADITLPLAGVTSGMVQIAGSSDFVMGDDARPEWPAHHRSVPAFYLDAHEVSLAAFRSAPIGGVPAELAAAGPQQALSHVPYDQALAWAEHAGKILPTETQYEFAATSGGTQPFPWGNDPAKITAWPLGAASADTFDHTRTTPPVIGLYSNVAEWTSTWMQFYPRLKILGAAPPLEPRDHRVVRGAPACVVDGQPAPEDFGIGPRHRMTVSRAKASAAIGFRGARSARPHLSAADFESVLRDGL